MTFTLNAPSVMRSYYSEMVSFHSSQVRWSTFSNPYNACAISESVCVAITVTRKRLVPAGTAGGRIAGANTSAASNASATSVARCGSPNITGKICVSLGNRVYPKFVNAAFMVSACFSSCRRKFREERMTLSAASAAANVAGGSPVVKIKPRARLMSKSINTRLPAVPKKEAHLDSI